MRWNKISLIGVICAAGVPLTAMAQQNEPIAPDPAAAEAEAAAAAAAGAQPTESTCEEQPSVMFNHGSHKLSPTAKEDLKEVAMWAKDDEARSVRLRGLTDHTGKPDYNARLSEKRADTVKAYLTQSGLDPTRITAVGHPPSEPKDPSEDRKAVEVTTCTTQPAVVEAEPEPPVEAPPPPVVVPMVVEPPPAPPPPPGPASRIGVGAMVGGGVTGFVDEETRDLTDPGGSWDARVTIGTRSPVAFEAAYIGSAQSIDALGLETDALILGQGAEGTARLNLTRTWVQPYVFGGVGWTQYQLQRTPVNLSSIQRNDNILQVPFGVGISFRVSRALLLDLRGTGRAAYYDEMLQGPYANTDKTAGMNSWNAAARLGWEF